MNRTIFGQAACTTGLLLLSALIAMVPQVTGLPRHRVLETGLFWLGQLLVAIGSGRYLTWMAARNAPLLSSKAQAAMALVSIVVLVAEFLCIVALTNLLLTSLQGAGLLRAPMRPGRIYPRELGYGMAALLLLAALLQLFVSRLGAPDPTAIPHGSTRIVRLILIVILAGLFVLLVGSWLLFLLERRFAVASVAVTWFGSFGFAALACEQLVWTLARTRRHAAE